MSNHQLIMNNEQLPEGYKQTAIGLIPEDWEVQKLGDIAKLERGKFSARPRNDPKFFGGDIPFIQTGDITNSNGSITSYSQTLNDEGLRVSRLFPKNTLFFTIAANIGDLGIASFATACPDSLIAILPNANLDKTWLYQSLRSRKAEFEGLATQNAQLNINLEKLNPYLLALPPLPEQKTIAQALSDADRLIAALEKAIAKKRAIKTATMQQLLTGKKRLPGFGDGKGYKESAIGLIPEDWGVLAIREITSLVTNGFVGKATDHYTDKDDGITYIQGYNVEENSFNFNGIKKVTPEFHRIHQKSCLKKDDLLTIQTGEVGLTTIVPESLVGANCHALIISRFKKEKAYPWFYAHYLNSPIGRLRLRDLEVGTTIDLLQKSVKQTQL
jgi:restriction endonuclease S subunit